MTTYAATIQAGGSNGQVVSQGAITFTDSAPSQPAALNQLSPVGTITSGSLPTVQLVSGNGVQILTSRDVESYTAVTGDATNNVASVTVALSPDNTTYSTILVPSLAAAVNNTGAIALSVTVRVPAGWYIKMTAVHMALGVTTYA